MYLLTIREGLSTRYTVHTRAPSTQQMTLTVCLRTVMTGLAGRFMSCNRLLR